MGIGIAAGLYLLFSIKIELSLSILAIIMAFGKELIFNLWLLKPGLKFEYDNKPPFRKVLPNGHIWFKFRIINTSNQCANNCYCQLTGVFRDNERIEDYPLLSLSNLNDGNGFNLRRGEKKHIDLFYIPTWGHVSSTTPREEHFKLFFAKNPKAYGGVIDLPLFDNYTFEITVLGNNFSPYILNFNYKSKNLKVSLNKISSQNEAILKEDVVELKLLKGN